MAVPNQPPNGTRKSISGFITKLVGDGGTFGFINDEIFFQQDVVVGGPVALNDRVFAECEYSENLPIKWNATSIKIIQRAGASPGSSNTAGGTLAPSILDSDPRRRQGILSQQQGSPAPAQQQPFNPAPVQPVANTYQQHRQQRQQQQQQLIRPFEGAPNQNDSMNPTPMRLLDQSNVVGPDFYPNQPFAQNIVAPQAHEIAPFQQQHDSPMGPPKITYTSQLGSAFVQGQAPPLVPSPFMGQSSTVASQPMLPTNQQQQQQQQQRNDQRGKQNRFGPNNNNNNQSNKSADNRRDQDNRNRNRNDNARSDHQSRNQDRDKRNDNRNYSFARDGSGGRNSSPRRDKSSRSSPPSHHPVRSRASISSERSGSQTNAKGHKRHYEPHNIPKYRILTNMNGSSLRSRCSTSVHVPSDLKDVIVNKYFRLDVKNTPKPIKYKIEEPISKVLEETKETDEMAENENTQTTTTINTEIQQKENESSESTNDSVEIKKDNSESSLITPPSSQPRSDIKLTHKYGVKVLLISLPELESIYKNVFGQGLDSYTNESSKSRPRLDESISLLCNKGSNGGHSLIGGKFDSILDGFVEGEQNEFERSKKQPDLIATCRRVVLEQTGLDLGPCKSWTLLSTFVYNNKTDYFSPKASIEYSYIYMPQIWTMDPPKPPVERVIESESFEVEEEKADPSNEVPSDEKEELKETDEPMELIESNKETNNEVPLAEAEQQSDIDINNDSKPTSVIVEPNTGLSMKDLSDLKVVDLKLELDKREVKYKPNAKKAELVALLHESLISSKQESGDVTEAKTALDTDCPAESIIQEPISTEVNVAGETGHSMVQDTSVAVNDEQIDANQEIQLTESQDQPEADVITNKRKTLDEQAARSDNSSEVKPDTQDDIKEENESQLKEGRKKQKVELIKEPFVVKAREGQQQLAVVSLYDVIQVSRYDQFELSVASNLLKESLVQHLSEYIFTTLVEENRSKCSQNDSNASVANNGPSGGGSIGSSSSLQEANNSDTNNNTKSVSVTKTSVTDPKSICKEYPVDRYINLACSYFDSTHIGYLHSDDLSKLFNNSGLSISKRALVSLIGDNDKFSYRTLYDLSPKLAPTYVYKFPEQFSRLPGTMSKSNEESEVAATIRMVEYQGATYDVASLVEQVRDFETSRVNMVERFNHAIETYDKQVEEIHLLEVNQKSLANAIKSQNDEISELKRERESLKRKLEGLRKGIRTSVGNLNELLGKEDK